MRRCQSIQDNLAPNQTACRLLFERLTARDQRHVAGLLALAIGHDGITLVGTITGSVAIPLAKEKQNFSITLPTFPLTVFANKGAGRNL